MNVVDNYFFHHKVEGKSTKKYKQFNNFELDEKIFNFFDFPTQKS
jgi:hypothetical protein